MNTATYTDVTATASRSWFKVLCAQLRDALETLGTPFVNGQYPSH